MIDCSPCSEFSDTVQFSTLGTIPTEPEQPILCEKGVKHLILSWAKRPSDESFTLQMNDESNYFRNKYTGAACSCTVTDLYRNTEYKFRVRIASRNRSGERIYTLLLSSWPHTIKRAKVTIRRRWPSKLCLIDPTLRRNRESKDRYKPRNVALFGVRYRRMRTSLISLVPSIIVQIHPETMAEPTFSSTISNWKNRKVSKTHFRRRDIRLISFHSLLLG